MKLGDNVTDSITGFAGIAVSRTEYLYGCVRLGVESCELKDGKPILEFFDERRLVEGSEVAIGGPGDTPPERRHPPVR